MKHTQLYRRVMATNHKLVVVNTDDRSTKWKLRFDHCAFIRATDVYNIVDTANSVPIEGVHIKLPDESPVVVYNWELVGDGKRNKIFDKVYESLAATPRKHPVILLFQNIEGGMCNDGFLSVRNLFRAATILVSTTADFLMDPPLKAILNHAVRATTTYEADAAYLGDVREAAEITWDRIFNSIWNNMMINRAKAEARITAMGRRCNRNFDALVRERESIISALVDGEIKLRDIHWRP